MSKIIGNKNEFNKYLLILRFAGFSFICSSWKVVIYEARSWNWIQDWFKFVDYAKYFRIFHLRCKVSSGKRQI